MIYAASFAIALNFASVAGVQSSTNNITEFEARVSHLDTVLNDIRSEVATLSAQEKDVDRSLSLRREEAESVRLRFPGTQVREDYTTQQFVSALRAEERRLLAEKVDALWAISAARREITCTSLTNVTRTANELVGSPTWAQMTLEARTAVREVVEKARRDAWADGDPCQPEVRAMMDDDMMATMADEIAK